MYDYIDCKKDFYTSNFPKIAASKKVVKITKSQLDFLIDWSIFDIQTNFNFTLLL